jgi:hypothetical protein
MTTVTRAALASDELTSDYADEPLDSRPPMAQPLANDISALLVRVVRDLAQSRLSVATLPGVDLLASPQATQIRRTYMPVTESRKARRLVAGVTALALGSALAVATAAPASAAEPFEFDLPAGTACDFRLLVEGTGDKRIMREFTDKDGNVVRFLAAGKGFDLTFTQLDSSGEPVSTVEFPSNGSVTQTTINADGTQTVTSTGHNVLILFPSDVPAGPSTTLYTGQLVFTIDTDGVFTVVSSSGPTTDICALLA